jgi:sugar phosphate permease
MFVNVLRLLQGWFDERAYPVVVTLTAFVGGVGQLVATTPLTAALRELGWTRTFLLAAAATAVLMLLAGVLLRPATAPSPRSGERLRDEIAASWKTAGTRQAFWVHAGLMGSFVTMTALWGVPYLVRGQGFTSSDAAATIAVAVAAFVLANPLLGRLASSRPDLRFPAVGVCLAVTAAAWGALVLWPARPPAAVVLFLLAAVGAAGAGSMLAFDLVRTTNPDQRAGTATGVANVGGFAFAVLAEIGIGALLELGVWLGMGEVASFRLGFGLVLAMVVLAAGRLQAHADASAGTSHALARSPKVDA